MENSTESLQNVKDEFLMDFREFLNTDAYRSEVKPISIEQSQIVPLVVFFSHTISKSRPLHDISQKLTQKIIFKK